MDKKETQKKIGEYITSFASVTSADDLAGSINGIVAILQKLDIDERLKHGADLLIAQVQTDFKQAALAKVAGTYSDVEKHAVAYHVNISIPEIIKMAEFEK